MSEEYFYHYTNLSSARRIFIEGKILPSQKTKGDAVHGDGVYLTTLDPKLGKEAVWKNNWDGVSRTVNEKMECYFEILLPSTAVRRAKERRDIQVFPGELPLSEYNWSLKKWSGELLATEHFMIRSEGEAAKKQPFCLGRYTLCRYIIMQDGTPVYKHDKNQIFLYRNSEGKKWFVGPVAGHTATILAQTSEDSSSPSKTVQWMYATPDGLKADETLRVNPVYVNHVLKKAMLRRQSDVLNQSNSQTKRQKVQ